MGDSELAIQHRAASGGEPWDTGVPDADDGGNDALLDGPTPAAKIGPAADHEDPAALFAQEEARRAKDGDGPTIEPKKKADAAAESPDTDTETDVAVAEPEPIEWKTLEDVQASLADADGVPADVRPYLEAAMAQLGPKVVELESEKLGLQQTKSVLTELAAKLEKGGLENASELTANYMAVLDNVDDMARQLSNVSWRVFGMLHPEYDKIPKDHALRTMFTKMLEAGDHFRLFEGTEKEYLDQIERTYELCAFRTKTDLSTFAPKPATVAADPATVAADPATAQKGTAMAAIARSARAAAPVARRGGSLVADGARAPTRRRVGVDERTDDEIMSEHEDLLGPN